MNEAAALFDGAAAAYGARAPYLAAFFRELAERIGLEPTARLLDLGAGPGPVALGLSPYCGECLLIDVSSEMLRAARSQPFAKCCRVSFRCGRAEDLSSACGHFDVVTIGRALHWLDRAPTLTVLRRVTRPGAHVVVCWAGTYRDNLNPWSAGFRAVLQRFRAGAAPAANKDPREFFAGTEFVAIDTVGLTTTHGVSVDELVRRLFSYSAASPSQVGERVTEMEAELRERLAPYVRDGIVPEVIHNTAQVFQRR